MLPIVDSIPRDSGPRPPSPTESTSTLASISSVQFELGALPQPLLLLMEEMEQAESLGEELPTPHELDLSGCASLTDALVCDVLCERFVGLRRLLLAQCMRLEEPAFVALHRLRQLEELDLSSCALSDGALQHLVVHCTRLQTLSLKSCRRLTDAGLSALEALQELRSLELASCKGLTDGALGAIARGCVRLESLSVAHCAKVGGAEAAAWTGALGGLRTLNVTATLTDDATLEALVARAPPVGLRSLNASRTQLGDGGVGALLRACTRLESLYLAGCLRVSDEALALLPACAPQLRELHLTGCTLVSDAGLAALADGCASLEVLGVDHCNISDASLTAVASQCAALRVLQASGCAGIGDASVTALARHCPRLERADLRGSANVSESAVAELERRLPSCRLLVNGLLRNIW